MSEWLSYSLSDFLLFSSEVYWRLVQTHSENWGAWAALFELTVLLTFVHAYKNHKLTGISILMSLSWLLLGWLFYVEQYQTINAYARYLGYACFVQSILYAGIILFGKSAALKLSVPCRIAFTCSFIIIVGVPMVAFSLSLGWQVGVIGVMALPTILLSLTSLMFYPLRFRFLLIQIPIILFTVEILTQLTLYGV